MTTRNEVLAELDRIELELKNINVVADNNGNFETSEEHQKLIDREDELMQELIKYPL